MALEFTIDLRGNFSRELTIADLKLNETERDLRKTSAALSQFEGGFFTFDIASAATAAASAIAHLTARFTELGKEMVKVAGDRQDLDLAIRLNVGDERAKELDELAQRFENATRFDAEGIQKAWLPLLQQGLGKDVDQLADMTTAATDYAARMKLGADGVAAAMESFSKIALKGEVNFKLLKDFGITENDYLKDLADLRHQSVETVKELMQKGKIDPAQLLNVTMNRIQQQQGGSLGGPTAAAAKTLGATLEKLGNLRDNLFEGLADSPGMKAIQGFLDNFIAVMQGDIGKDLIATVGRAFERLFGDMSGPEGLAKMEAVIDRIAKGVERFIEGFANAWPEIQADFEAALPVVIKLAEAVGTISRVLLALPRAGEAIGDWLADVDDWQKTRGVNDLRFDPRLGKQKDDGEGFASTFLEGVREGFDMHSPSKKMAELGGHARTGFEQGLGGSDAAGQAMANMMLGAGASTASAAIGGSSFTIGELTVVVQGGASNDSASIGRAVRSEVEQLFSELAAKRGAA